MIKHTDHGNKVFLDLVPASYLVGKDPDKIKGSYYITGDEWGMKKRPKYEWSAGKQI